ncbi:MAG: hypothetical protein OEY01_03780 [Desulfobulbaceae bacterium]|nr:hypothetical protein [Desulfobulbaceae bacterium]
MGKTFFKKNGIDPNPVGPNNRKTGVAGTYAKVGETCPSTCPYLDNGCYAQHGQVNMHQNRAVTELEPSLSAAALAMYASIRGKSITRLHVSGDFGNNNTIWVDYILGLCELASSLKELMGIDSKEVVAFTYTHFPKETFEPYRLLLKAHGISVVYSDIIEVGGAIVANSSDIPRLRGESGLLIKQCLNQTADVLCKDCTWCWTFERRKLIVAFDPHGSKGKTVQKTVAELWK